MDYLNTETGGYNPFKRRRNHKSIYIDQLICLLALTFMATWRSGFRALMLVAVSVVVSVFVDMICCGMSKKTYNPRDISTITAGIGIALMMPASIPYPMIICGAALAMGIKHIFGGKDNYIFNPTAVTLAFLIICYPASMLLYPKVGDVLPIFGEITTSLSSGIESFLMKLGTAQELSLLDVMLGNFQGPIGTTHVLVILICAVCLLFRRSISATVTLSALLTILLCAALFPLYQNFMNTLVYELIGGYLLFGILFLANDPQTVPKTELGKFYCGVILGFSVILFRYFGKVEGSFVFALLIVNTLSLRFDSAAEKSISLLEHVHYTFRRRVSSYERIRETAKQGGAVNILDTQEIVIDPINYDMPPIDNKVVKINRKKRGILTITREKLASASEKGTEKVFKNGGVNSGEDIVPEINMRKHVKKQISSVRGGFLNFISRIGKMFSKPEIVEPIRHKSQLPNVKTLPQIAKVKDEAYESDIEISDFEELSEEKEKTAANEKRKK